ncbi:DUF1292 domain-containing protein [Paenibacillus sp. SC116]|uniref:DUF1292 domain-containing protein n=1 Tax=Paenibacillus sp. SC116 TaxID=2968986 RepID=UPI00215A3A6D|nr:DUF1292 domain-containing protein [Paenibacillus sp. SC116]MCR8845965.1 DUF1292 domain-containing protein [Paenibacillus sp. SC116]
MSEQKLQFIDRISSAFGTSLEMTDEQGTSRIFDLLAEFQIEAKAYAVVQDEDGEIDVLRITDNAQGEPQLETIEDDEEWENAMELYDEVAFSDELEEEK